MLIETKYTRCALTVSLLGRLQTRLFQKELIGFEVYP